MAKIPFPCEVNKITNTVDITAIPVLGVDMDKLIWNLLMNAIQMFPTSYVRINQKLPNGNTIILYTNSIFQKEI